MDKVKIERINFLAKKSRESGLSDEEKKEQDALRKEYIASIRAIFRQTLENIEFTDKGDK